MNLTQDVLDGKRLALARLLSKIENEDPEGLAALNTLFPHTGRAYLLGATGAPGTGKSSLVNQLAAWYRNPTDGSPPRRVAIVAVDPSSPFTGGAVLGDRIRMRELSGDKGVFIRSMATRGSLGGLAATTAGIVQAFDAAGFDIVIIETVGAGQSEVDIARLAHTTLVIEAPGLGDDIQAIKAGILEIADVLVINKADRPGVENTERALKNNLKLAHPTHRVFQHHGRTMKSASGDDPEPEMWIPPIARTIATTGKGIADLAAQIETHRQHLETTGDYQRRERARLQTELDLRIQQRLVARWQKSCPPEAYEHALKRLIAREIAPSTAVDDLIDG